MTQKYYRLNGFVLRTLNGIAYNHVDNDSQ